MMGYILTAVIAALVGYNSGWIRAHRTVLTECERLGSFYVGTTVVKCESITRLAKAELKMEEEK